MSQDLDVRVGNLGQNQNNVAKRNILLMLITEHEEKNVLQVENENKLDAGVIYVVCHLQRWRTEK